MKQTPLLIAVILSGGMVAGAQTANSATGRRLRIQMHVLPGPAAARQLSLLALD